MPGQISVVQCINYLQQNESKEKQFKKKRITSASFIMHMQRNLYFNFYMPDLQCTKVGKIYRYRPITVAYILLNGQKKVYMGPTYINSYKPDRMFI